jgi:hypothetical protein
MKVVTGQHSESPVEIVEPHESTSAVIRWYRPFSRGRAAPFF